MTPFEKWCNENGYDPLGQFVVVDADKPCNANLGDLLRLIRDDGTGTPWFIRSTKDYAKGFDRVAIGFRRLTQHKTEPKMTEQKPIPRMVEVRDREHDEWKQRELIADLSDFDVENPYVCRYSMNPLSLVNWNQMREIPQPKTRPMTPRELLDAIRNGAVWRKFGADGHLDEYKVYYAWDSMIKIEQIEICYDWHGTDSDVWVNAEVTE